MISERKVIGQTIVLSANYTIKAMDSSLVDKCFKDGNSHGKRGKKGKAKKDWEF